MRPAVVLTVAALALMGVSLATSLPAVESLQAREQRASLLYPRPAALTSLSLAALERWQVRALAHYRGALAAHERVAGRRALSAREWTHRRWYRLAVGWTGRELRETRERIAARRAAEEISGMWYAIAVCESGSRPPNWHINTGNGYYGGLQFDYGTWHEAQRNLGVYWTEYAHQAASWQQVRAASTLPLTRWPVCGRPYR